MSNVLGVSFEDIEVKPLFLWETRIGLLGLSIVLISVRVKGNNEILAIWKLQMNRWKKIWMQIRYLSRLKQTVV